MLNLENISKTYNHRHEPLTVFDGISYEMLDGDFISIVGPSGSGKSTLLLMLGGMMSPSSGKVVIDGESIYDLPPNQRAEFRRQKIGFVFQTFNLVPYLSALENVQMPLFLAGLSEVEQEERATSVLERLGLGARLAHKPSELSVGQQQRVALARMLANDPTVVLADEPTGSLDPETSAQVMEFFEEINQEGRTVVIVTHDPNVAQRAHKTLRLGDCKVPYDEQTPVWASVV
ncbi:MAG: ABC transporter ATP-binding protein [Desulfomonilaceae bacterium]